MGFDLGLPEWSRGFPHFLQFKYEFGNKEFMIQATVSSMDMSLSKKTLGDGEGQGSLACCIPWTCKELDTTEQLNN